MTTHSLANKIWLSKRKSIEHELMQNSVIEHEFELEFRLDLYGILWSLINQYNLGSFS